MERSAGTTCGHESLILAPSGYATSSPSMMCAGAFLTAAQCKGRRPHCDKQSTRTRSGARSVESRVHATRTCLKRAEFSAARADAVMQHRSQPVASVIRLAARGTRDVGYGGEPHRRCTGCLRRLEDGVGGAPLMRLAAPAHCLALITACSSAPCDPMSSCLFSASRLEPRETIAQ